MISRKSLLAGLVAAGLAATPLMAKEFKFAFQGTLNTLDPYTLNETFTLGVLGNVYEGLTRRGPNLSIQPALAVSWEVIEPTRWRFKLRQGVKFHNGNDFNADDVVFSANRVRSEGSDLAARIHADAVVEKVDDYTVDFVLPGPNPILHYEWDTWVIMDKEWTEANNSVQVTSASDTDQKFAALNANGTGAFKILSHEVGVQTKFEVNPNWWDEAKHNLTSATFTPIGSDATRVAALLSGELDMAYPIPVQDIKRVGSNEGTDSLIGPELRTIFLGMDQRRDELLYSNIKGKNPLKDIRVREAFMLAIDIEAIKSRIMRGLSEPSAIMISPALYARGGEFIRPALDVDRAKELLTEAGYPDGFEITLDCPNDRYVNDEAICQAVVSMLARVDVKVDLNAQPKAQYFAKVLASNNYDTSFYLLGWTPGSLDSWNILSQLHGCRDDAGKGGLFNLSGYCNEKVDALAAEILVENDATKRDDLIKQAFDITTSEFAYVPLHQQGLSWGTRTGVELIQRADNALILYHVNMP